MKQEKGTCPCCRKEMTSKEDFPQATEGEEDDEDEDHDDDEDEDEDEDEDDEEDVEFSRQSLDEFLRANGGSGLTNAMAEVICGDTAIFTESELNFLCIGNGARNLTNDVWNELLIRDDLVEPTQLVDGHGDESNEGQISIRIHLTSDDQWVRTVSTSIDTVSTSIDTVSTAEATVNISAEKIQAAWRGYKTRSTLTKAQAAVIISMLKD